MTKWKWSEFPLTLMYSIIFSFSYSNRCFTLLDLHRLFLLHLTSSKYIILKMDCVYNVLMISKLSQLSTDIFGFKMAKLMAVKICYEVRSTFYILLDMATIGPFTQWSI